MAKDEERHADEVNIAFQMGAEWQKKQSDSAWKGIHEGAVLALQARIEQLEVALEKIGDLFSDAVQSDCENGVRWLNEIAAASYLKEFPDTLDAIHQMREIIDAALEEKKDAL